MRGYDFDRQRPIGNYIVLLVANKVEAGIREIRNRSKDYEQKHGCG